MSDVILGKVEPPPDDQVGSKLLAAAQVPDSAAEPPKLRQPTSDASNVLKGLATFQQLFGIPKAPRPLDTGSSVARPGAGTAETVRPAEAVKPGTKSVTGKPGTETQPKPADTKPPESTRPADSRADKAKPTESAKPTDTSKTTEPAKRTEAGKPTEALKPTEPKADVAKPVDDTKTSPSFEKLVRETYDALPAGVRKEMEDAGYKIVTGHHMTQAFPELKRKVPRGWPPGSSWDNAEGTVMFDKKSVVIVENKLGSDGKYTPSGRVPGVFRHEFGHAVNSVWGSRGSNFSDTAEFMVAYERDVAGIQKSDLPALAYLLQKGAAGRDETFADVFANLNGGPSNAGESDLVRRAFPEVAKLIKKQIDERNKKK